VAQLVGEVLVNGGNCDLLPFVDAPDLFMSNPKLLESDAHILASYKTVETCEETGGIHRTSPDIPHRYNICMQSGLPLSEMGIVSIDHHHGECVLRVGGPRRDTKTAASVEIVQR
jgi:hypothetical protein